MAVSEQEVRNALGDVVEGHLSEATIEQTLIEADGLVTHYKHIDATVVQVDNAVRAIAALWCYISYAEGMSVTMGEMTAITQIKLDALYRKAQLLFDLVSAENVNLRTGEVRIGKGEPVIALTASIVKRWTNNETLS